MNYIKWSAVLPFLFCFFSCNNTGTPQIERKDHQVKNGALSLFVREIYDQSIDDNKNILLMLHGGGPAGVASFDIPVADGSFAAFFAEKGFKVYLMDIRGWGGSTDPEFDSATDSVNVTYQDAAEDIDAVVEWIRQRDKAEQVKLFGWATGGHWGGYYCTQFGDKVSHFISLNSLYPVAGEWGLSKAFADSLDSTRFDTSLRGWRIASEDGMTNSWDNSIPVEDKTQWRDTEVAKSYASLAVETDISFPDSVRQMKVPAGFREESFRMAHGTPYWSANDISSRCLIIRGALDFWSRPVDLVAFKRDNPSADTLTLPKGTHFVFIERMEVGKQQLVDAIISFINN